MAESQAQRVKSLDGIPEFLQPHFVEIQNGDEVEFEYRAPRADVSGLKSTLAKQEREIKRLQAERVAQPQTIKVGDDEFELDQIAELVAQHKAQNGKQLISVEEADKRAAERLAKALKAPAAELEQVKAEKQQLNDLLHRVLVDDGIRKAAADPDAPYRLIPKAAEILVKIAKADGEVRVFEGKPTPMDGDRPALNDNGNPRTLTEWIAAKADELGLMLPSQGAGAQPANGNGALNGGRLHRSKMSIEDRAKYISEHGDEKYLQLPF